MTVRREDKERAYNPDGTKNFESLKFYTCLRCGVLSTKGGECHVCWINAGISTPMTEIYDNYLLGWHRIL